MRPYFDDPQLDEMDSLRALVREKEQSLRAAQERVNDIERDWLYTTCRNFRGTIEKAKAGKARFFDLGAAGFKLLAFAIGVLVAPARGALRLVGLSRRGAGEAAPEQSRLKIGLSEPVPESIVSSKGNSFVVHAWAFHPTTRIAQLELRLMTARRRHLPNELIDADADAQFAEHLEDGDVELTESTVPIAIRNVTNRRVLTDHYPVIDPNGNSFWGGFCGIVSLPPAAQTIRAQLSVRACLENGAVESAPLAKFTIQPGLPEPEQIDLPTATEPLVAICMTTYNPPPALFKKQIDSIRAQTHRNWICIIRDDGSEEESDRLIRETIAEDHRFTFRKNRNNLGFYKNFEAVLADVPANVDYVALSDQDDYWHEDKLATLLQQFAPGVTLVYSDTNIVDETGFVWSRTYWTTRDNNCTDYPRLLIANTITGAASMIRRNLLDYLLPFPEKCGDAYHDHWLGCIAIAMGHLHYINRPLYDYTQHKGNVVGHVAPQPGSWAGAVYRFCAFFWPLKLVRNVSTFLRHGRGYYFADLLRIQHTARNVMLRCRGDIAPDKRLALAKVLDMANTWSGRLWLATRPLLRRNAWRETVGVEAHLLQAVCWRIVARVVAWWGTRLTARGLLRGIVARQCLDRSSVVDHIDTVAAVTRIISPLTLAVRSDSPPRVNVVVSIIDFRYVFGGYITVFHMCRKLALQGFRVRLVVVDECDFRPVAWADSFRNYPGLEDFLDRVELVYAFDRKTSIPVSRHDAFLATSWWTAHVAHQATKTLGKQRFVYLIQEYEPGFYAYSSLSAFAAESYDFPHYALFSTEILREYFQLNHWGVFARTGGDQVSESFQNAITSVGEVTANELRDKRSRKLLFYCRPEPHALRNMFDTGLMALRRAVQDGGYRGWEFHGIGSMAVSGKIKLADGVFLNLLPRLDQEKYRRILKEYDVGLSLMCSPHPSLVPLEMAKAGMVTITNTYANKSAERLRSISTNFLPTGTSVEAVTKGLVEAMGMVRNYEARANGSRVKWATDWDMAFPESTMSRLAAFIRAAMSDQDLSHDIPRLHVA